MSRRPTVILDYGEKPPPERRPISEWFGVGIGMGCGFFAAMLLAFAITVPIGMLGVSEKKAEWVGLFDLGLFISFSACGAIIGLRFVRARRRQRSGE